MKYTFLLLFLTPFLFFCPFSCSYIQVKSEHIDGGVGEIEASGDSVGNGENKEQIKILQISDLHLKKNKAVFKNLIKKINKINPDVLLITGDSIDKSRDLYLLDDFLEKIEISGVKYAVPGNWEYWAKVNLQELDKIYKQHDVQLLINQPAKLEIKNRSIYLYGTDDSTAGNPSLKNMIIDPEAFTLIMTHSPLYFDSIVRTYPDQRLYVLSGHTHGGQITFFGKPFRLPRGSGPYVKGIYGKKKSRLYVSKGIGNSVHDFRLFAAPDIYLLILE